MPREPRSHVPAAFYHVVSRGNNQQDVFRDESYYLHYLSLLERYTVKHSVTLHAYALMTNHIHLLVQIGDQPLGEFMQGLQQSYTQYVNKRNHQTGHLFQGRYYAKLIDDDGYLLAVVRYIHLNPVAAGLVDEPLDYRWSSHRHYFSGDGEGKVETCFIRSLMDKGGNEIGDYQLFSDDGHIVKTPTPLPELVEEVAKFTQLPGEEITGTSVRRDIATARRLLAYVAVMAGHSIVSIASFLGRAQSSISTAVSLIEDDIQREGVWSHRLSEYTKQLKIGV